MNPLVLGVDPGFKGALALVDFRARVVEAWLPMPVMGKGRAREIDVRLLCFWLDLYAERIVLSVLELALTITGQGLRSTARSWQGRGDVRGALVAKGCGELMEPEPVAWLGAMGLSSYKPDHVLAAEKIFPGLSKHLHGARGGINDGLADAALIAVYGIRLMVKASRRIG